MLKCRCRKRCKRTIQVKEPRFNGDPNPFSQSQPHLLKSPLADVQVVHVTTAAALVAVVVTGIVAARKQVARKPDRHSQRFLSYGNCVEGGLKFAPRT